MTTVSTTSAAGPISWCERCGRALTPGALACGACGALAYRAELERLADQALRLEPSNPPAAAMAWRKCLHLLPPDSQQYQMIHARIGALAAGVGYGPGGYGGTGYGGAAGHGGYGAQSYAPAPYAQPAPHDMPTPGVALPPAYGYGGYGATQYGAYASYAPRETWLSAIAKTGGSMLLSLLVYSLFFPSVWAALGFVLLMLVHELGHSWAMAHYKLNASPPIFIPFMGAVINLRQQPPNAKVEAIVGIGGPVLGTVGALICFAIYLATPAGSDVQTLFLYLSAFGFLLNLFNLLPVPPLDGGRVTAAVSPWIWMLGVVALVAWIVSDYVRFGFVSFIKPLILIFALPRILATLRRQGRAGPYYAISRRASWTIGLLYLGLGLLLTALFAYTNWYANPGESPLIPI